MFTGECKLSYKDSDYTPSPETSFLFRFVWAQKQGKKQSQPNHNLLLSDGGQFYFIFSQARQIKCFLNFKQNTMKEVIATDFIPAES